jgi:hypothetical protein
MEVQASPELSPTKTMVWRDPVIFQNAAAYAHFRALQVKHCASVRFIGAETTTDAGAAIDIAEKSNLWVISSATDNGGEFLRQCRENGVTRECFLVSEVPLPSPVPGVVVARLKDVANFVESVVLPA